MNAAQVAALSQIQAQAIVHARKTHGTPQQVQTQIQLQAQALVHAHTQAQIAAGIYKGDASKDVKMNSVQLKELQALKAKQSREKAALKPDQATEMAQMDYVHKQQLEELNATFRKQNAATAAAAAAKPAATTSTALVPASSMASSSMDDSPLDPAPSATSPQFLAKLHSTLNGFWTDQLQQIQQLPPSTEQDFKTHNDLPLARIKRIMKSDEDVRMISAEAPVLFAKACELFILELTLRSWSFSQHHKRRTLQKEDIKEAIQRTDIFDFLVDVIQ
jgi:nuclear transcription factor Y gamma